MAIITRSDVGRIYRVQKSVREEKRLRKIGNEGMSPGSFLVVVRRLLLLLSASLSDVTIFVMFLTN